MLRNFMLIFVFSGLIAVGTTAFTASVPNEMINSTPNKSKSLNANVGDKNLQNTAPVKNTKANTNSWCEEDCGKQLKPGTKSINVQK